MKVYWKMVFHNLHNNFSQYTICKQVDCVIGAKLHKYSTQEHKNTFYEILYSGIVFVCVRARARAVIDPRVLWKKTKMGVGITSSLVLFEDIKILFT